MKLPIVHEGMNFLKIALFLAIAFYILFRGFNWQIFLVISLASLLFFFFVLYFFRNPYRHIPQEENMVLSPADGRIMEIDRNDDGILIKIFLSVFDVHIQRAPFPGKIESVEHKEGQYLPAFKKNAAEDNTQNLITIDTGDKLGKIWVKQIAGIIARRVVSRCNAGDTIVSGQEIGFIYFGSQVDIRLPKNVEIIVGTGDRVYGGTTILGVIK